MVTVEQICDGPYGVLVKQMASVLAGGASPYKRSLIKFGLSDYPDEPKEEYLLQSDVFTTLLSNRRRAMLPIVFGRLRKKYSQLMLFLEQQKESRFSPENQSSNMCSPLGGGVMELCLLMYSLESDCDYTAPNHEDEANMLMIKATKLMLGSLASSSNLPERLLFGVHPIRYDVALSAYDNC